MICLGFKENKRPELVESEVKPTKQTQPQYALFVGPSNKKASVELVEAMTGLACGEG